MPRCPRTNTRNLTRRKSRVPPRRYKTAEVSFLRGIRSSPCIELRPLPLHFIWGPSLIFILFHNYFSSFLPTLAWLVVLLCLFLNIYNTRCGSWSHLILAMPTDCITTYRSFIPYISALPPSLSYTFYIPSPIVFFLFPFSNRSFLPVHQLCRFVIVRYVHSFPPRTGLDWTGLDSRPYS